jgi:flavin reductase (DIM6/NTAB) family NADH-FMN oxidoreductase RutF
MPVSESFKHTAAKAIGRIPSGVFVLTARDGDQSTAILASWVQQASFDPPVVSVAIARDRPILGFIERSGMLAIAIIGENDRTLMKHFARGFAPDQNAFAGVEIISTPRGIPVPKRAIAWAEAKVIQRCDFAGDHDLILAEVTAGDVLQAGRGFTHQRGSGMHY